MLLRSLLHSLWLAALLMLAPMALSAQEGADQMVEVVFTPDMDKAALQRIQEEVKAKGVTLVYDDTDFKDGRLHHIAFSVITPVGSGKAEGDVDTAHRPGFSYDPREGADVTYRIGRSVDPPAVDEHAWLVGELSHPGHGHSAWVWSVSPRGGWIQF